MATPSPAPQRYGKYVLLERIALGGMAEIHKARLDGIEGFQRTLALKRVLPHLAANQDFVAMLVDEAKIAGLLSHANIVQVLDLGQAEGRFYIAMEYVQGRDVAALLRRCAQKGVRLPVSLAVHILIEVLKGLAYAHDRKVLRGGQSVPLGIVHRDISPANLLLSHQGEVKIVDFGIAKASVKALETVAGVVKGRFDYMSPEQSRGNPVDRRADLFAAGVVLYELLTGTHPFRMPGELATVEAMRKGAFVPPSRRNPDVPEVLDQVMARALRVDAGERYAAAEAFRDDLERYLHDSGVAQSPNALAAFLRDLGELEPTAVQSPPRGNASLGVPARSADPSAAPPADRGGAGGLPSVDVAVDDEATEADDVDMSEAEELSLDEDLHRKDTRPFPRPPPGILREGAATARRSILADATDARGAGPGVAARTLALPGTDTGTATDVLGGLAPLPLADTGAFGPIAGLQDESTFIRSSPAAAWSEADTVIRGPGSVAGMLAEAGAAARPATPAAPPAPPAAAQPVPPIAPVRTPLVATPPPDPLASSDLARMPRGFDRPRGSGTPTAPEPPPPPGVRPAAPASAAPPRDPVAAPSSPRTTPGRAPRADGAAPRGGAGVEAAPPRLAPSGRVGGVPRAVHLVYAMAIVASAIVGLAVGAVLAPGNVDPAVTQLPPVVQVVGAPGVSVTVDGRPAGAAPVPLRAGTATRVEITRVGKPPTSFDLTLDWNQLRVLDVRALDGAAPQETSP